MMHVEIKPCLTAGSCIDLSTPETFFMRVHGACETTTGFVQGVYGNNGDGLFQCRERAAFHLGQPIVIRHDMRG